VLPVSSFNEYGGHAAIHVRYDAKVATPLYRQGENAPGDNIAFLQGRRVIAFARKGKLDGNP